MLVAAWRAGPALRARIGLLAHARGCVATSHNDPRSSLWLQHPCVPGDGQGAEWSDGSLRVGLGETCVLHCAEPTQRSLFVAHPERGAVVASTSLPLLVELLRPALSVHGLAACLLTLGLPDRVAHCGIERVEAGKTWTYLQAGGRTITEPVPELEMEPIDDPERARNHLEAAIGLAVDGAIRGSHSVGILLSGGLDSSVILAALAERIPTSRIVAVTWDLGGGGDRPFVEAWERRLGLGVERVTSSDASRLLAGSLVLGGAPTALMTGAFERAAMRRAKERGADVLLTGVGGDESFAGSLQAAVRSRATPSQVVCRALLAELPWSSTAYERLSELVLRPALRPFAPRSVRERNFMRRTRAELPALGPLVERRLREAARLHVGVVPRVPTTPLQRFRELARRPFWLEMGELRAQLEAAEHVTRFDVPLDAHVHRAVAAIEPHLLLPEHRHRGLLRRVLQARAPQVVTARLDKADFDDFGQRMMREAKVEAQLRSLACGKRLGELGLVKAGEVARLWNAQAGAAGYPRDLSAFLGWWPFLSAEAFARDYA